MVILSGPLTEIRVCFFEYVGQVIMPLDKPGVQCLDKKSYFQLTFIEMWFSFFFHLWKSNGRYFRKVAITKHFSEFEIFWNISFCKTLNIVSI